MTERERDLLESLIETEEYYADGEHVVLERGQLCDRSTMLIEGFVIRQIRSSDKRFIVGVQVPGDFVDLHAFALKRLDHDIVTVGPARIGYVPHERLREVLENEPHLTRLLWFSTLLDAAIHREWIMAMERMPADGRLAHLCAEMWCRLQMVGLADDAGFYMPVTQSDLADMCGTTAIHMNRTLRTLREEGILDLKRGHVTAKDRQRLEEYANFTKDYLYGEGELGLIGQRQLSID
ncbi:Crp/Fnr family transcriptional regulator [Altericroceibacterium endophyticum]|uniref:Crp/Fnr family transcriptional regulator n=1 Tax=Altericroceibacterium endophyticum TaxID=1808508 RepID=UPI001F2444C7|nr:Crp/Fnr family transcriptional regulator [Altericroceibacterium endophyticum]